MKDGKLKYCYNWFNRQRYTIESANRVPAGKAVAASSSSFTMAEELAREAPGVST